MHNTNPSTGTFSINKRFRSRVNYSLKFKTSEGSFKPLNDFKFTSTFKNEDSNGRRGPWNVDITYGRRSSTWARATMMNAIYHFRVQALRHRLKLPGSFQSIKIYLKLQNSGVSHVTKGSLRHSAITSSVARSLLKGDVMFYVSDADDTPEIYQTMMHELGHISHILKSPNHFQGTYIQDPMAVESFATAVEYYFTLPYYPNEVNDIPEEREDQINEGGTSWQYTPFFIDLRDAQNQRTIMPNRGAATDYADDNVSGYTLEQMQKALDRRTTLRGVQQSLINNYSNPTEGNIERMRNFYKTIKENKR